MFRLLNKRLEAFSLSELLVVMVISGILTAVVYYAFTSVLTYHRLMESKYDHVEKISRMRFQLERDFLESTQAYRSGGELRFTYEDRTFMVRYVFYSGGMVRQQEFLSDTLEVDDLNIQLWNKAKPMEKDGLTDAIDITFKFDTHPWHWYMIKEYDVSSRLSQDSVLLN
jgi:prepilin-type N-terminal cleavage/methylation domain-containing protein